MKDRIEPLISELEAAQADPETKCVENEHMLTCLRGAVNHATAKEGREAKEREAPAATEPATDLNPGQ